MRNLAGTQSNDFSGLGCCKFMQYSELATRAADAIVLEVKETTEKT